jgi:hypothetical protein
MIEFISQCPVKTEIHFEFYIIRSPFQNSTKWYYWGEINLWEKHFIGPHNTREHQKLFFLTNIWPTLVWIIRRTVKTNDIFEINIENRVDLCMSQSFSTTLVFVEKFSPPSGYHQNINSIKMSVWQLTTSSKLSKSQENSEW